LSWKACAGLGLCLGAALLTKSTALLAVPVVFGALLWKTCLTPRTGTPRFAIRIRQLGLALATCAAVCGWHYARLWAQFGSPLIGVWDPQLGFSWWQDDGYRTSAFYLRFGAALAHPWFSSFKSFGDGIYATLWGDGLFGGRADAVARPPWDYDLMAVGYWLALLPTFAVLVGGILALVRFLRQPSPEWFLLLGLAFLAALAMVHLSITLPYQCHVKAFYGLCALVPFCAFGAWGLDELCGWGGKARPMIRILAGIWAVNSYAMMWISPNAVATLRAEAQSLWNEKRQGEAVELLVKLDRAPTPNAEAQACLAYLTMDAGDLPEAARLARAAVQRGPNEPTGHLVLSAILARQQRLAEAIEHARRAVQLVPGNDPAYHQLSFLLLRDGQAKEAIRVARDGLAVAPFNPELRSDLGASLVAQGETAEGMSQLRLACSIKPNSAGPRLLLGETLASQGKLAEAAAQWRDALRVEPGNAQAHCHLAVALAAQHQTAEALTHYTEALRLDPDFAVALNNVAWIRAANPQGEFRNGPEAVRLAERACRITQFKEPVMVGTLAAAYAEAGRFEEAAATAKKARELALAAGQKELADKNQALIKLFGARQPYREPSQPGPQ
jgi:Flp pilus assembly protein TadD